MVDMVDMVDMVSADCLKCAGRDGSAGPSDNKQTRLKPAWSFVKIHKCLGEAGSCTGSYRD